jgi:malate synthase
MVASIEKNIENMPLSTYKANAYPSILSPLAVEFLEKLHQHFEPRRKALLARRLEVQKELDLGKKPNFLPETATIRKDKTWQASPVPNELQNRKVEITGPVDKKMIINALNSGAKVFMADFEDSNSPTWENCLEGQANLYAAIRREIDYTAENGKVYALQAKTAILMVRPRAWHLSEKNFLVGAEPISASLFDFGLFFFHNAKQLIQQNTAPYFYLPKMENHLEAALWNDVFVFAQQEMDIPVGTIKATVLIETILAAFEMDEIIYALREHIAGLNAGRWDYLFSAIKKFAKNADNIFPDRSQLTMQVPFMSAYAKLLVKTCHTRGIHAMGGMAAFIPNRKNEEINKNAFAKVQADKNWEAKNGFDGTWVAHPDLVPIALTEFEQVLAENPNQKQNLRTDVEVLAEELINFEVVGGKITEQGLRMNIYVGILYIESWLNGLGAVAINNLMEDAATAEISRSQVWQCLQYAAKLEDGRRVDANLYEQLLQEELQKIKELVGELRYATGKFEIAAKIFDDLVQAPNLQDFLTIPAYQQL